MAKKKTIRPQELIEMIVGKTNSRKEIEELFGVSGPTAMRIRENPEKLTLEQIMLMAKKGYDTERISEILRFK